MCQVAFFAGEGKNVAGFKRWGSMAWLLGLNIALQDACLEIVGKWLFYGGEVLWVELWEGPVAVLQVLVHPGGVGGPGFLDERFFLGEGEGGCLGFGDVVQDGIAGMAVDAAGYAEQVGLQVDRVSHDVGPPALHTDMDVVFEGEFRSGAGGIQIIITGALGQLQPLLNAKGIVVKTCFCHLSALSGENVSTCLKSSSV